MMTTFSSQNVIADAQVKPFVDNKLCQIKSAMPNASSSNYYLKNQ